MQGKQRLLKNKTLLFQLETQQRLVLYAGNESLNFPKLERVNEDIYLVWTQPDENGDNLSMLRLSPKPIEPFI